MKRVLATSLVTCMVVGCMAGCGKDDTPIDNGDKNVSTVTSNETAEQAGDADNEQVSDNKKSEKYVGKMLLTVRNQDVYKHLELSNENRYLGDVIDFARSSIDVENYPAILHSEQAGAVEAFRMLDLAETDLNAYAIGMTPMTDRAYGVMVLKPVDGARDKVKGSLNALKEDTAELFKNTMPDQYDIAKSAIIGELGDYIYFVMTNEYKEVSDTVKLALGNQDELNNYIEVNVEEYDVLDKFIGDMHGEQVSTDTVDNKESDDAVEDKADDSTDKGTKNTDTKTDATDETVVGGIDDSGSIGSDVVVDSGVQSDENVAVSSNDTPDSSNDTSSDWE